VAGDVLVAHVVVDVDDRVPVVAGDVVDHTGENTEVGLVEGASEAA
jgi:hypothetical protein